MIKPMIVIVMLGILTGCSSLKPKSTTRTTENIQGSNNKVQNDIDSQTKAQERSIDANKAENVRQNNNDPWIGRISIICAFALIFVIVLGFWFGGFKGFGRVHA